MALHRLKTIGLPPRRRRLSLRSEIALALLPTACSLIALACIRAFTDQQLMFASLAASSFLIYLDPAHSGNTFRALAISQTLAALVGWGASAWLGTGFWAAALAMIVLIAILIAIDAVHPPAVATALAFTLHRSTAGTVILFGLALLVLALLLALQWASARLILKLADGEHA